MKNKKRKSLTILSISIFLLVLNGFWGFVYTNTIYAKPSLEYAAVAGLTILFASILFNYNCNKWSKLATVWAPYIFYTFFGYALTPAILAPYWLICLIVLLVANTTPLYEMVPNRLLFWGAIFALVGVFVQMLMPSFYSAYVAGLFLNEDRLETWGENYGFNGFTYQLGATASILIYGEAALLYMKDKILPQKYGMNIVSYVVIVLFIIGVFLAGKRALAAIAVLLPFLVYFFTQRITPQKIFTILFVAFASLLAFEYFIGHISEFSDSFVLRRFADSYTESKAGHDITSSRTYLYGIAIKLFYDNPIFGVGVGQFRSVTGAYTAVHNTYLQVLCEQGIVGFIVYIYPIIYCFVYTLKVIKRANNQQLCNYVKLSLAFQLIYMLYSLTGNENIGSGYIMYFIGIAIVISVERAMNRIDYQSVIKQ